MLDSNIQYSLADFIVGFAFPKSFVVHALSVTPSLPSEKIARRFSPSRWFSTFTLTGGACASDQQRCQGEAY
jgi:hypothetical protein